MTVPSFRAAFVAFLALLPPAALATPGEVYYIHTDHLDTPREVRDAQNTVVWKNPPLTEPFGLAPPDEDPDGDGESFTLNLRFPGQYYDKETNTHYNYFRDHYFPELGRYGQSDPIGLEGGINTYAYVSGNPLRLTDPFGLAEIPNPNGVVPGDLWTPAGPGQPPGTFYGPKIQGQPQDVCRYVPEDATGTPHDPYWKSKEGGSRGWNRFDMNGNPISSQQAHPGNKAMPPSAIPSVPWQVGIGIGVRVIVGIGTMLYSSPAY